MQALNRVLLIGAPGIGKTDAIYEYAKDQAAAKHKQFVDLKEVDKQTLDNIKKEPNKYFAYLRVIAPHIFPEDVSIPRGTDEIMFKSPLTLDVLNSNLGIEGILFIDELTNVQRADQRVLFYSLIYEGEIGWSLKLSDKMTIIAAGNPPEWSSDAGLLPAPLVNKMTILKVSPPKVDEWNTYMLTRYGDAWDQRIASFLFQHPESFIEDSIDDTERLEGFATPRAFTTLAVKLKEIDSRETAEAMIEGIVGNKAASLLVPYLRTMVPTAEEFLDHQELYDTFKTEQKFLIMNSLAQMLSNKQRMKQYVSKYEQFLNTLVAKDRDMAIILIRMLPKKNRATIINEPPFATAKKQLIDRLKYLPGII